MLVYLLKSNGTSAMEAILTGNVEQKTAGICRSGVNDAPTTALRRHIGHWSASATALKATAHYNTAIDAFGWKPACPLWGSD